MNTESQENEEQFEQEHFEDNQEVDSQSDGSQGETEEQEIKTVPLRAVQKERKKRQEAEALAQRAQIENEYLRSQFNKNKLAEEEDESIYESATRKEMKDTVSQTREEVLRDVREEAWSENNPEKADYVNENLANFLKQRPNLVSAVQNSKNRYKEAYELMSALSPKQQQQMTSPAKQKRIQSPGSPNSVPKSAGVDQVVNLMAMSDSEYNEWRKGQRKRK